MVGLAMTSLKIPRFRILLERVLIRVFAEMHRFPTQHFRTANFLKGQFIRVYGRFGQDLIQNLKIADFLKMVWIRVCGDPVTLLSAFQIWEFLRTRADSCFL